MARLFTESELEAYLEESLSPEEMAAIEAALRKQPRRLLLRLSAINARRDAGVHSLGEIWRRHRVSCPTREHLGSFLLGALDEAYAGYIAFHLQTVGCRFCLANLEDLKRRRGEAADAAATRRRKYFQSSAGYLRREK
jgi:hypothetical protein